MTELPNIDPLPEVAPAPEPLSRADLLAVFHGMNPGWYTSALLLPRVNAWLEREGRPSTKAKTLGETIARTLGAERRRVHNHVSAWNLTDEMVGRG